MPEWSVTFNLPEEAEELKIAMNAGTYLSALQATESQLKSWDKHGLPKDMINLTPEELVGRIRDWFIAILNEYEVDLY